MSVAALDHALGAFWIDVLRHLWQSTLVLVPLFFVARVLRTAPARWSHRLWAAALAKLFVPLAVFGPWAAAALRRLDFAHGVAPAGALPGFQVLVTVIGAGGVSVSSSGIPAPFWIACTVAYAGISFALLVRTGRDLAAARRIAHEAVSVSGPRAERLAAALERARLRPDRVMISGSNLIPAVVGTLRPRIVVPLLLLDELDVDELAAVLLHEDMHRRHADPAIALIQRVTTSLLFFFPLLAPLQRRIREAAELRCDEGVLRAGAEASTYARALARTVQLGLDPSPAPAALDDGNPSLVARRIDRLKEPGRTRIMMKHRLAMGFAMALLAAGIFLPVTGADTSEFKRVWNLDRHVTIKMEKVPAVKVLAVIAAQSGVAIENEGLTDCCLVSVALAEGFVVLAATVGTDGAVSDVQVLRHADGWPSLDQAAIDAVRQFVYKPAMKDGQPVVTQMHVKMEFSLQKDSADAGTMVR